MENKGAGVQLGKRDTQALHPQALQFGAPQATGKTDQPQRLVAHCGDQTLERARELDDPVASQRLHPGLINTERLISTEPAPDAVQGVGDQVVVNRRRQILLRQ